ncbi:MAG TPA: hypothetical protein PK858_06260, partial [Saprospiraceae bacterium]|nr:hypothetical protein [Saprospiraceae bacterium]
MKLVSVTLLLLSYPIALWSQCSEMPLNTLQVIQKEAPASKENEILKQGFDLSSEQGTGGANVRKYVKCWNSNGPHGASYFDQVILWHTNTNTITFLTLDENTYGLLRKAVEERHPGSSAKQALSCGSVIALPPYL